jgi:hydrogenase maturation protein HypF
MAFSYLNHYPQTRNWIEKIPALRDLGESRLGILREMVEKQVNSPWSSGAGRLFDAVSVILGLCYIAGFDAEPPMRLESIIDKNTHDNYSYDLAPVISFEPVLDALIRDLISGTDRGIISARFHNTVACIITGITEKIREETKIDQVVLSGGVFQNRYLLSRSVSKLGKSGFRVFFNHQVPLHDGGIALGQLLIASENLSLCV